MKVKDPSASTTWRRRSTSRGITYRRHYTCSPALGVLTSTRGKLGGFELAVPSATLSLFQVVVAFDDLDTRRCLLGVRECSDRTACAAHEPWKRLLTDVTDFLQNTTIEEIANGLPHSA